MRGLRSRLSAVFVIIYVLQGVFEIDGELLTMGGILQENIGDEVTVRCNVTLTAGESVVFLIKSRAAALVSAAALDNPTVIYITHLDQLDVVTGDISSDIPPHIPVAISFPIEKLTREHEGDYACQYGAEEAVLTLHALGPPDDVNISTTSEGVSLSQPDTFDRNIYPKTNSFWHAIVNTDIGGLFLLEGQGVGKPAAEVTWYDSEGLAVSLPSIEVERYGTNLHDSILFCSARNRYGTYNASVKISAEYKPRGAVMAKRKIHPPEGLNLSFICGFDARPPAEVFYAKENPTTMEWTRQTTKDSALYIDSVDLNRDTGKYKCVGENNHGTSEGEFYISGKPADLDIKISNIYSTSAELRLQAFSNRQLNFQLTDHSTGPDGVTRNQTYLIRKDDRQDLPDVELPYLLENLDPSTNYLLTLVAMNEYGNATSSVIPLSTAREGITKPPPPSHIERLASSTPRGVSSRITASLPLLLLGIFLQAMTLLILRH